MKGITGESRGIISFSHTAYSTYNIAESERYLSSIIRYNNNWEKILTIDILRVLIISIWVAVSSDESKLKSVIVFYPRVCNVWFKGYLFSTRGEACKSKKSVNCLCFILSFYYNVSLSEEMLIFVKRSLTKKLWIRGDKNFVFFMFFLYFSISLLL